MQGLQFAYQTPLTLSSNLTVQRALTQLLVRAGLVRGDQRLSPADRRQHQQRNSAPARESPVPNNAVPFPDFAHGSSYHTTVGRSNYNGLQTRLEKQFSDGLQFLAAYTWSKTISDAGDLLNGGSINGYRAPDVPGLGPSFDRALADFDIRNVFHLSGYYELPVRQG